MVIGAHSGSVLGRRDLSKPASDRRAGATYPAGVRSRPSACRARRAPVPGRAAGPTAECRRIRPRRCRALLRSHEWSLTGAACRLRHCRPVVSRRRRPTAGAAAAKARTPPGRRYGPKNLVPALSLGQIRTCLSMKVRSPMPCSCSCLSPTRSQRRRRELHGADSDMAQRLETAMAHTLRLGSLAKLHG